MKDLMEYIIKYCNIHSLGTATDGVELMTRENEKQRWMFVLNHTNQKQEYKLEDSYEMLVGELEGCLKPYEIQILKKDVD